MQVSQALNPRRIARTLVTIFVLTFIQTVVPTVVAPIVTAPKAKAASTVVTITPTSHPSGTTIVIPSGVFSVTIESVGGAGGKGGDDVNTGKNGTVAGRTIFTVSVTPGDVLGLFPGNKGTAGSNGASNNGGGAGGATTLSGSGFNLAGTIYGPLDFGGGTGGNAGSYGSSGGGGGAGAASIATVNNEIVGIAGGAGGGGGTGSGSNYSQDWNGTRVEVSPQSFKGGAGTSVGTCTGSGGSADGGGGGGGGGGYYGGTGGLAPLIVNECAGFAGSPGGNYVASRATGTTNDYVATTSEGYVKYTYEAAATTTCASTTTTVDIYTVEKFTYTGTCTWSVPSTVSVIDFFMVGGGGGGAGDAGGGGGGGGVVSRTAFAVTPNSTLTLRVGYGGGGNTWGWVSGAYMGGSTALTSGGTTITAYSGNYVGNGPGTTGGAGGVAVNGGFAGGQGGTGASSAGGVGAAGKSGVSNYFYGVKNEYSGGGSGGSYTNGAAQTPPASVGGGGIGSYAINSTTNAAATNGVDGTGGGGGGGTATASGIKMFGGKGGSGVILIRYATNSADSFPVGVASALAARYLPGDLQLLDSTRKGWIDSSGTNASRTNGAIGGAPVITTRGTTDGVNSTDSSKTLLVAKGVTTDSITLTDLPTNYTLFSVARYVTGGTNGRVITASGGNWFSGFYGGMNGCAHHATWLTGSGCNTSNLYGWQLSTDQLKNFRQNGSDVAMNQDANNGQGHYYLYNQSTSTGFGINNDPYNQHSNWEVADILIFNRQLGAGEIRSVENYLARIYGLTLASTFTSSETDTAASLTGGQHFYGQYLNGLTINDTFTIEAWVKLTDTCESICQIFVKENTIIFGIHSGTLRWALNGKTVGGWNWTDTGIRVTAGEWHHVAIVKQYTGDKNGSMLFYLDGQLGYTHAGSPYASGTNYNSTSSSYAVSDADGNWPRIGVRDNSTQLFYGQIDEFKLWRTGRTASEVASDMHSNDKTSPALELYYDFNRDSASNSLRLINLADYGPSRSDMTAVATTSYVDVKSVSTSGPYTKITFPRTYITQSGGWKAPTGVSKIQTVVVGGGGGGGGGYQGGGGGAGGFIETLTTLSPGTIYPVRVGVGGQGLIPTGLILPNNGDTSTAFGLSALGGGRGASEQVASYAHVPATTGGSGGGGTWGNTPDYYLGRAGTSGQGNSGGNSSQITGFYIGAGGGGAGAAGGAATSAKGGDGGAGLLSNVTGTYLAGGGGGAARDAGGTIAKRGLGGNGGGGASSYVRSASLSTAGAAVAGTANTGGGGGAGLYTTDSVDGPGAAGGSGLVALRYITATKPTFTQPTNTYLNVGMTETFTTNVIVDSATAGLTRTFRWESTTAGSGGTYSVIKVGTGALNAAFSWVPSDTSTSGSQFLYRVVVTDSDTAGLFIVDTSTAVYAVINRTLQMTGVNTVKKAINVGRSDTFTVIDGTPSYRYTLSPTIAGITLDTSTVGSPVFKISDTATIGTFIETLTVIDSVSASVAIPISITISAPPTLTNTAEVITTGQVFAIDTANSASYNRITGTFSDISGAKHPVTITNGSTYSTDYSGILSLASTSSQYISATGFSQMNKWTIDTWIRLEAEPGAQFCILSSEYAPTNISFALCVDTTRRFFTGFHNGYWTYKRSTELIPLNNWTHIVGTFDGSDINLYINGSPITVYNSGTAAGTTPPPVSTDRIFLGKDFGTAVGTTATISYASARLYNIGFTQSDVLQNYNATKERFTSINLTQIKPSQKYGSLNLESFTVTSGGDTKTVSFAVGNRTGIRWDTSTVAGRINLSVQESLTPGTYYDTITVLDNFGQSSILPITFTVSKADTVTVVLGSATTQVYNSLPATLIPSTTISGLVSSDTGTVQRKYTGVDWTKTCAQGGGCEVGDTGPGGGTIFYISPTVINASSGISSGGTYLEVAPLNWSGLSVESTTAWAKVTSGVAGTLGGIGRGAENTRLINAALGTNAVAAKIASDLTLNGKSDWFLPSTLEVKEIYDSLYLPGLAGNFGVNNYWTSTEDATLGQSARAETYYFGSGGMISPTAKTNPYVMRPIRAYSPDTITVTTVPTNADSYSVTVDTITMTSGSLSYYQNVTFVQSGLEITKARQNPLNVNLYGATTGLPFTITLLGGSGSGAVTESLTAGSTATSCSITSHVLTSTSSGTCNLQVKKAASRNYQLETASAVVYFLNWVTNQPTNQVGGGSSIGLNGITSVTLDPNQAPTISSLSTYTATAGVTQLVINGAGFNHLDTANIIVKFWRNKVATGFTVDLLDSQITVTVPAGSTTGKVTVTTPNGIAVSELPLTITP